MTICSTGLPFRFLFFLFLLIYAARDSFRDPSWAWESFKLLSGVGDSSKFLGNPNISSEFESAGSGWDPHEKVATNNCADHANSCQNPILGDICYGILVFGYTASGMYSGQSTM